ncbi:HPP family protein [Knoellia sp. CPCC 206453]|uniref:CBS domain-containing protein n=1 Tax=Knoellia pratensis TaxID=3404796 RepID=UPI00361DA599
MLVAEVMTTPAESIRSEATLEDAIAKLGRARISALPVVDSDQRVVGIISEGDVLRHRLPADPRAHLRPTAPTSAAEPTIEAIMTADPSCATLRQDCAEVALTLARRGWKSMPVVDDEHRLLGVVSRSDFLRTLSQPDAVLSTAVHCAFAQAGHPEWRATVHDGHVTVNPRVGNLADAAMATAATVAGIRSVALGQRTWADHGDRRPPWGT